MCESLNTCADLLANMKSTADQKFKSDPARAATAAAIITASRRVQDVCESRKHICCTVLLRSRLFMSALHQFAFHIFFSAITPVLTHSGCWQRLAALLVGLSQALLPGAFPADWAGYAFSSPRSLMLHVCFVKIFDIGLPLMLLPSCHTDMPPPDLSVAGDAHLLWADLHIPIKLPEFQHTLRLLSYGVTGAHTEA